jgi:MoxR-like ATPase
MNVKATIDAILNWPMEISILLKANHGVGKSGIVKQVASALTVPCIDFRLSQNDVGDLKGMPFHVTGRTFFAPPEFMPLTAEDAKLIKDLLNLTEEVSLGRYGDKGILFLDEINRASREVQQAAFELVLDRRMNLRPLPVGWRVISAINGEDDIYKVNSLDPAFLSRFFLDNFEPTYEEWLDWAGDHTSTARYINDIVKRYGGLARWGNKDEYVPQSIHPAILEFLRRNPKFLDPTADLLKDAVAKGVEKVHDRRAWEMFSKTILKLTRDFDAGYRDLTPLSKDSLNIIRLREVAAGYVGSLAAGKFVSFIETDYQALDASTILNKWDKDVEKRLKEIVAKGRIPEIGSYNEALIGYMKDDIKGNLNPKQCENLLNYISLIPNETLADFWTKWNSENKTVSEAWYASDKRIPKMLTAAIMNPTAKPKA